MYSMSFLKVQIVHNNPEFLKRNIEAFAAYQSNTHNISVIKKLNTHIECDLLIVFDTTERLEVVNCKYAILIETEPTALRFYVKDYYKQFDKIYDFNKFLEEFDNILLLPSFLLYDRATLSLDKRTERNGKLVYLNSGSLRNIYHFARFLKVSLLVLFSLSRMIPRLDVINLKKDNRTKLEIYSQYHAAVVLENTIEGNYISEKLLDAYLAVPETFYLGANIQFNKTPYNSSIIHQSKSFFGLMASLMSIKKHPTEIVDFDHRLQNVANYFWLKHILRKYKNLDESKSYHIYPARQFHSFKTRLRYVLVGGISTYFKISRYSK
jgi:hypothetical protein